jgi:hypothetical protein
VYLTTTAATLTVYLKNDVTFESEKIS